MSVVRAISQAAAIFCAGLPTPLIAQHEAAPGVAAVAHDTPVASLVDAIQATYASNPDLLAQRARVRATDNRLPAARAAYGPQITVSASAAYDYARQEVLPDRFASASGTSTTAQLVLSQPLFTFGRNRSAEQIATAEIEFAQAQLRYAENQILLTAVQAYVGVARDTALVAVSDANLKLLEDQYAASAERFSVREITISDLQQVETRRALARAQLLQARGELAASRSEFLRVIGRPPADVLAPIATVNLPAATLDAAYTLGDEASPLLAAAHAREKISRAGIEAARAEMGPRIDLQGSAQRGQVSPYSNDLSLTSARGMVVFQMPLVDSGLRRSRLAEARESNDADWRLIDGALRETRQSIAASWQRANAAQRSLSDLAEAATAAQRAYDGAVIQEKAGFRTTLDVLDLARDLLTVRTNLITAQANLDTARATLLATLGALSTGDVATLAHREAVAGRGDVPWTPLIAAIDSITVNTTAANRPIRDPARNVRLP